MNPFDGYTIGSPVVLLYNGNITLTSLLNKATASNILSN